MKGEIDTNLLQMIRCTTLMIFYILTDLHPYHLVHCGLEFSNGCIFLVTIYDCGQTVERGKLGQDFGDERS